MKAKDWFARMGQIDASRGFSPSKTRHDWPVWAHYAYLIAYLDQNV